MRTLNETIRRKMSNIVEAGDQRIETFQKRMAENPAYAFEWADDAMEGAAKRKVAQSVLAGVFVGDGRLVEGGFFSRAAAEAAARAFEEFAGKMGAAKKERQGK